MNFKKELVVQLQQLKLNSFIISTYFEKETNELNNLSGLLVDMANNFQLNNADFECAVFEDPIIILLKIQQIFKAINSKFDISTKSSKKFLDLVKELIELLSGIDLETVIFE